MPNVNDPGEVAEMCLNAAFGELANYPAHADLSAPMANVATLSEYALLSIACSLKQIAIGQVELIKAANYQAGRK